ncbi:MAG TPA: cell shape determination protein CcmA [Desulfofustis sp.]|jgi:cytoskeletal protein CcmA (bactofilin family)|nr:cell shape determination protein CcmA [Desulfofustis sp.]HBH32416.1 cell shape determination protein CcmA [Desulfofustis sp.]
MFNKKTDPKQVAEMAEKETITSIISKSMIVKGEISFEGKARIDGIVEGNVSGKHLILSETGSIKGDIKVTSLVSHGPIEGNISADLVTAKKGSSLHGKIATGNLAVEPGAAIDGEVKTTVTEDHKSTLPSPPTPAAKKNEA